MESKNPKRLFPDVRMLAIGAVCIALNVVLTRYFSINTQFLRIGFGFLPVAVFSMLYGAIPGGLAAAAADVIGFILTPTGPYFPGFTLSAFLLGAVFGLFLYQKEMTLKRIVVCCVFAVFAIDALNTVWLMILYHYGLAPILLQRIIQACIKFVVEVALLYTAGRVLKGRQSRVN